MKVYSIFVSIDGEINKFHQGCFSTFVRLSGCNIQCGYCFGVRLGRRVPKVILSSQPSKQFPKIQVGDCLMTFDSEGKLVETTVTRFITREVDSWLRITIGRKIYFVTPEHLFFTTRGLLQAAELVTGDMIYHSSPVDKISFSKIGKNNPMKRREVVQKSRDNTDYRAVGRKTSQTIQRKKEQGLYKSTWCSISLKTQQRMKEESSIRMVGENNPNWKGGSLAPNYDRLRQETSDGLHTCSLCGSNLNINIHHRDQNQENDKEENLQILCHSCHCGLHRVGYNFWSPNRKDGLKLNQLQNGVEVQKIEFVDRVNFPPSTRPKKLKVYNLSCAPYDSYLVDYMWVHNCDTKYALLSSSGRDMSVDQLIQSISVLECKKVTITGGEPLLQKDELEQLCIELYKLGYNISIETNGTIIPPQDWHVNWVVDYKLPSSGEFARMRDACFIDLDGDDFVKFVVGGDLDYELAIDVMKRLQNKGCKAKFAFSPLHGHLTPAVLTSWMIKDKLFGCLLNVQLHKYIDLEEDTNNLNIFS